MKTTITYARKVKPAPIYGILMDGIVVTECKSLRLMLREAIRWLHLFDAPAITKTDRARFDACKRRGFKIVGISAPLQIGKTRTFFPVAHVRAA